ncbi:MAG TPA: hypothetical protein VM901_11245 [Bdellovibrionota bacterium]|jgi:hypothetical protein|nr:hypothetical protein [Bdellovibrionota bacterium]
MTKFILRAALLLALSPSAWAAKKIELYHASYGKGTTGYWFSTLYSTSKDPFAYLILASQEDWEAILQSGAWKVECQADYTINEPLRRVIVNKIGRCTPLAFASKKRWPF